MDNEALPAFANAENRAINKQVEDQEKRRELLEKQVAENTERVKIMKEHLKNVHQELSHTQSLVEAKVAECKSEEHLKALSERAVAGTRSRIQKYKQQRDELQDRLNSVQNVIFKGNEKLDRFKLQMNWNQEELEQWALAAKQKEEDNLALQKYSRADEAKIKEVTQQIQKATVAVSVAKEGLENEVTETQSKQIELDKTADEFRRLHKERQDLVQQWQESIEAMRRRDEDIRQAGERYAETKQVLGETKDRLKDAENALADIKRENAETEGQLKVKERKVQLIKLSYNGSGDGLQELKDEADVLKNQLAKQSADLAAKRQATNEQRQLLNEYITFKQATPPPDPTG